MDAEAAGQLADALDASSPRSLTTSVAPNSRASAMRSAWRPRMMICSAPSRLAAITPHRPTAPSPTTATLLPGPTSRSDRGVVAGAHHVGQRQQRRHQRVVLADRRAGRACRRPSGMRSASAWAPSIAAVAEEAAVDAGGLQPLLAEHAGAVGERERHDDDVAALDRAHVALPTSSTMPIASWPIALAVLVRLHRLYGHRSLPQMQARVTRISASVGFDDRRRRGRSRCGRRRPRT